MYIIVECMIYANTIYIHVYIYIYVCMCMCMCIILNSLHGTHLIFVFCFHPFKTTLSQIPHLYVRINLVTEGELTLWWRFDDELWTRFVYVVLSVFCLSWVIPINNDPVRKHDGSCSETSHAKHVPVRKRCFN